MFTSLIPIFNISHALFRVLLCLVGFRLSILSYLEKDRLVVHQYILRRAAQPPPPLIQTAAVWSLHRRLHHWQRPRRDTLHYIFIPAEIKFSRALVLLHSTEPEVLSRDGCTFLLLKLLFCWRYSPTLVRTAHSVFLEHSGSVVLILISIWSFGWLSGYN